MRISFDIDDTLVCSRPDAPNEAGLLPNFIHRWLGEPLCQGTRSLFHQLRQRGFSIWIYTTSVRTPFQIRLWLLLHGIRVDGVINEERHRTQLAGRRFPRVPSKFPPAFGIDLHVDDSEGVKMEAQTHGFRVVVVRPNDELWEKAVLTAAEELIDATLLDPDRGGRLSAKP
jgi:hypothetical protein